MQSTVLHRLILAGVFTGALAASGDVFASCGEPGRPPCLPSDDYLLERIDVVGYPNPWDVVENCWGETCNWEWGDEYDDPGSGTGSPVPGDPPGEWEDTGELCGTLRIFNIPWDLGGGSTRIDMCYIDSSDNWLVVKCNDYPLWGDSACHLIW